MLKYRVRAETDVLEVMLHPIVHHALETQALANDLVNDDVLQHTLVEMRDSLARTARNFM